MGENASAVLIEEGVFILDSSLGLQQFTSLVPVDIAEAGIHGSSRVTSSTQMLGRYCIPLTILKDCKSE